jgi:hypothetical protein
MLLVIAFLKPLFVYCKIVKEVDILMCGNKGFHCGKEKYTYAIEKLRFQIVFI